MKIVDNTITKRRVLTPDKLQSGKVYQRISGGLDRNIGELFLVTIAGGIKYVVRLSDGYSWQATAVGTESYEYVEVVGHYVKEGEVV